MLSRQKVVQLRRENKEIIAATGYNYTTNDYPQHGIHGLYFLTTAFGLDVEKISQQADGWWRDVTPTNKTPWTYGSLNVLFRSIKVDDTPDQNTKFLATQVQVTNHCSYCNLRVYASKPEERGEWTDMDARNSSDSILGTRYYRIFLAAFKSHVDDNGQMVEVDTLSDDWTAPTAYPDWIDEKIFG